MKPDKRKKKRKTRTLGRKMRVRTLLAPAEDMVAVRETGYIVVVVNPDGSPSMAKSGGWTAFTGTNLDAVIKEATNKMRKWEAGGYGPYELQVGTLYGRVEFPTPFVVVPL